MNNVPLGNLFMKLIADTKSFEKMLATANRSLGSTEKSMGLVAKANAKLQAGFKRAGSFGDSLTSMAGKADKAGKKLTNFVTIPLAAFAAFGVKKLLELAGANSTVGREVQKLSDEANALKKEFTAVAIEVGRVLLPYLILVVRWIRVGIQYWEGLSDETKKYVGIAVLLLAALGPLLQAFAFFGTVIGVLITGISAIGAALFGWLGVLGLVVVGLLAVTDTILQLTDAGNLGIMDLVGNFRIGGAKIYTWMSAVWMKIFQAFDNLRAGILMGFTIVGLKAQQIATSIRTYFLEGFKQVVLAYLQMQKAITFGEGANRALDMAMSMVTAGFDATINSTLKEAENRQQAYYDALGHMTNAHLKEQEKYSTALQYLFSEDAKNAENSLGPLDRLKAMWERLKGVLSNPDIAAARSGRASRIAAAGAFETVAMRRMSIESPGGLTSSKEKSSVADEGSHSRLDELIKLTRGNNRAAVLG